MYEDQKEQKTTKQEKKLQKMKIIMKMGQICDEISKKIISRCFPMWDNKENLIFSLSNLLTLLDDYCKEFSVDENLKSSNKKIIVKLLETFKNIQQYEICIKEVKNLRNSKAHPSICLLDTKNLWNQMDELFTNGSELKFKQDGQKVLELFEYVNKI